MNILKIFMLSSVLLVGCNNNTSSMSSINEQKCFMMHVKYDYGIHVENSVSILLNDSSLFFDPLDYGIEALYAGDALNVYYTGDFNVLQSYPSQVITNVVNVEIIEANVVEFKIETSSSEKKELVPLDPSYEIASINTTYVVDEERNYKSYEEYSDGTIIYGLASKVVNCICIESLHSYKVR